MGCVWPAVIFSWRESESSAAGCDGSGILVYSSWLLSPNGPSKSGCEGQLSEKVSWTAVLSGSSRSKTGASTNALGHIRNSVYCKANYILNLLLHRLSEELLTQDELGRFSRIEVSSAVSFVLKKIPLPLKIKMYSVVSKVCLKCYKRTYTRCHVSLAALGDHRQMKRGWLSGISV